MAIKTEKEVFFMCKARSLYFPINVNFMDCAYNYMYKGNNRNMSHTIVVTDV